MDRMSLSVTIFEPRVAGRREGDAWHAKELAEEEAAKADAMEEYDLADEEDEEDDDGGMKMTRTPTGYVRPAALPPDDEEGEDERQPHFEESGDGRHDKSRTN